MVNILNEHLEQSDHLQDHRNDVYDVFDAFNKQVVDCCQTFYQLQLSNDVEYASNNAGCFFSAVYLLVRTTPDDFSTVKRQLKLLPAAARSYFSFLLAKQNEKYLHYLTGCFEDHHTINDLINELRQKMFAFLPTFSSSIVNIPFRN